ncbi:Glycosyltransferase involved in cell wall bisynthesis [Modestobacter sp. DSM 44400]|uniref:glycosyltransferase family 4 protein n=1 Tax=Modestobacter sp. DSM 44400 TaxID=1550230 RepID=UPI0008962FAF|nr:glycosyltransferase family 4 protein [Modestobacter sp. DSM 44400]SDY75606.1 Glycosyltransferase involved in cell wall bisynthesis [Modestobacter sp. DSM 44400]
MRIVYIHQYFRTPEMSGGTRSYEFARRLVGHGHQVSIVTADAEGSRGAARWRHTVEQGIDVHWIQVPYDNSMPPWRRIIAFVQFMLAAMTMAARLPQDVVLATSTPLTVSIPGAWSAFRNKVPMVLEIRDLWPTVPIALGVLRSWPTRTLARALERWSYARARKIIALSPDMVRGVLRVRPEADVTLVPNAADMEFFSVRTDTDDRLADANRWLAAHPVVLYAGTFGLVNGVGYLVELAAALKPLLPSARVVLIGAGAELDQTRDLAARLGVLDDTCLILGSLPKTEVAAWFRASTLTVSTVIDVPELTANSSNKVFDALAAGRPVAVNHGGWLADAISESGAGLLLPPQRPAEAAQLVAEVLADPERQQRAGEAARQLALTSFDRDRLFVRFEQVLRDAVSD